MEREKSKMRLLLRNVVFYLLYGLFYLISLLPMRVLYLFSDVAFVIVYHVAKYRRRVVEENLRTSFPEKTPEERRWIERRFYLWFSDYIFETIKLASMPKWEMRRRVKYTGLEHIDEALAQGHSVALYLGHYCNWEWVTSIALHLPKEVFKGQIYHTQENSVFDDLLLRIRSRMGSVNISSKVTLRTVVEQRRAGRLMVIGFISDQSPIYPATRYWTDFLNHKDSLVITGTEELAKRCDFACVYFNMRRLRRGYYQINIEPLTMVSKDYPDYEITEMYVRRLEETIRQQPQYWLWTHNRWKRTRQGYEEYVKRGGKVEWIPKK